MNAKMELNMPEEIDENADIKQSGYFVMAAWGNPHRGSDEWFWMGPFESKTNARKAAKRIVSKGPRAFIDWCGFKVQVKQGWDNFQKKYLKATGKTVGEPEWYYKDDI
jgi:hypothetical protein